jgi:abortive infection bacteriophage resistance protein
MSRPLKPWLSIDDQIDLLRTRGMQIPDPDAAAHALTVVGYYRLSGYWYSYRRFDSGQVGRLSDFLPGTDFADVWTLYDFDRRLKSLVLDGIERIEVAFRSRIGHLVGEIGPLAHTEATHFRSTFDHANWLGLAKGRVARATGRDQFVDHHHQHYDGQIPIWVLTDLLDFADLSKLYAGMIASDQKVIAEWFKVTVAPDATQSTRRNWAKKPPLTNWLEHLSVVRNICAHHGRLWNRQLTPLGVPQRIRHLPVFDDLIPTFEKLSEDQHQIERVYGTICIISYLLHSVEASNAWRSSVDNLVDWTFPQLSHRSPTEMGFPNSPVTSLPS